MGQVNSCVCAKESVPFDVEEYVDQPHITKEDAFQIKNCFDYLEPEHGVVLIKNIKEKNRNSPEYVREFLDSIVEMDRNLTFDEFYRFMKPKAIAMKTFGQTVKLEKNSTSVSCFIWPYARTGKKKVGLLNYQD